MFYQDVLAALQAAGARYVLVGGVAVILHGVPRTTADIDIVIDLASDNVLAVVAALTALGFVPRNPVNARDLADPDMRRGWIEDKGMRAFAFHRPGRPLDGVDILFDAPLDYQALVANVELLTADGLVIPLASARDLIALKEFAGRAQDVADIDALRRILGAG